MRIVGVSFDTPEDNRKFKDKFTFPFPLLCDTDRTLGLAYGACDDKKATHPKRITVVIDAKGKVQKVYDKVDAKAHPEQVLADLAP